MLRDDAIRQGLIKPTQEDIERMNLIPKGAFADYDEPKSKKETVKAVKKKTTK